MLRLKNGAWCFRPWGSTFRRRLRGPLCPSPLCGRHRRPFRGQRCLGPGLCLPRGLALHVHHP